MQRFLQIEKLDKTIKYEIIGVPKCGTTSLGEYLIKKGYDVIESEFSFLDIEKAENYNYYWRTPIIVTRNPIERAWSDYCFFKRDSIKHACDYSFFKAGLQMWDSLIYSLEYLKTVKDFPKINNNENKPKLTPQIKNHIIHELSKYN